MRVTNFKTHFLKNGSSDHFGTNVPDLGSSSTLLGYKSPSYDFSKKFKVLLGRGVRCLRGIQALGPHTLVQVIMAAPGVVPVTLNCPLVIKLLNLRVIEPSGQSTLIP